MNHLRTPLMFALLLFGCRDFDVPGAGLDAPLTVDRTSLSLAPEEKATFVISGGKAPFQVRALGGTAAQFAALDGATESGGWVRLPPGNRIAEYTAGATDSNSPPVSDTFEIVDAKGDAVKVTLTLGQALEVRLPGNPAKTDPGGRVLIGASGGKPPYFFGLAISLSGGSVDTLSGHYLAGEAGCVKDVVLVQDAVGAQATGEITIICPVIEPAPDGDVFALFSVDIDQNGIDEIVYVVNDARGAALEIAGGGGALTRIPVLDPGSGAPILGRVISATAARGAGLVILAINTGVDFSPWTRVFHIEYRVAQRDFFTIEPIQNTIDSNGNSTYPIQSAKVDLQADAAQPGGNSDFYVVSWQALDQNWVTKVDPSSPVNLGPALATNPGEPTFVTAFVAPSFVVEIELHPEDLSVAAQATKWHATSIELPGPFIQQGTAPATPITNIGRSISTEGPYDASAPTPTLIGILGRTPNGPALSIVSIGDLAVPGAMIFRQEPIVELCREGCLGPLTLASGQLDGTGPGEFITVDGEGKVRLIHHGLGWQETSTPWVVDPNVSTILATDLDGDGVTDLLFASESIGLPRRLDATKLPVMGHAQRGVFGRGTLFQIQATIRPGRISRPAVLAIDSGLRADGSLSTTDQIGGGLVIVPAGAVLGEPVPVPVGRPSEGVTHAVSLQLQEGSADPYDVVAALGTNRLVSRIATQQGNLLPPEEVIGSDEIRGIEWLFPMRISNGTRGAVLIGIDTGGERSVRAVVWNQNAVALGEPFPLSWISAPTVTGEASPTRAFLTAPGQGETSLEILLVTVDGSGAILSERKFSLPLLFQASPPFAGILSAENGELVRFIGAAPKSGRSGIVSTQVASANQEICFTPLATEIDRLAIAISRDSARAPVRLFALANTGETIDHLLFYRDGSPPGILGRQNIASTTADSLSVGPVIGMDEEPDLIVSGTPMFGIAGVPHPIPRVREGCF